MLELARELAWLAGEHPRFAAQLNKLMVCVRLQARPGHIKRERIIDALGSMPMSIEELADETMLDKTSLKMELQELETVGLVDVCDRNGNVPGERTTRGQWERHYRRRRVEGGQPSTDCGPTSRNNVVGSSRR